MLEFKLRLTPPTHGAAWFEGLVMSVAYFIGSRILGAPCPTFTFLITRCAHVDDEDDGGSRRLTVVDFTGGLLPMLPYFMIRRTITALYASIAVTVVVLILFGYIKARLTGSPFRERIVSAFQTLAIGVVAASLSYGVVKGINSIQPSMCIAL